MVLFYLTQRKRDTDMPRKLDTPEFHYGGIIKLYSGSNFSYKQFYE